MSKAKIILISVLIGLIAFVAILFGTVFCLRHQEIERIGEFSVEISNQDIISTAGFKKGGSIFMLDKEKATQNIEKSYPEIKVVQIRTVSINKIQIVIKQREKMFYYATEENYYILDEECKILEILTLEGELNTEPTDLIKIDFSIDFTNLQAGDFASSDYNRNLTQNLYIAIITNVTKQSGENEDYYTREDMKNSIKSVSLSQASTLKENYTRLILLTRTGETLDIAKPEDNLCEKINICYSAINKLKSEGESNFTIKIYLDKDGNQKLGYSLA